MSDGGPRCCCGRRRVAGWRGVRGQAGYSRGLGRSASLNHCFFSPRRVDGIGFILWWLLPPIRVPTKDQKSTGCRQEPNQQDDQARREGISPATIFSGWWHWGCTWSIVWHLVFDRSTLNPLGLVKAVPLARVPADFPPISELILEAKLFYRGPKVFLVQFPVQQLVSQPLIGFFQFTHSHGVCLGGVERLHRVGQKRPADIVPHCCRQAKSLGNQ